MKVLFASRLDFGLRQGGLQKQLQRTAAECGTAGVEVVFCDPWKNSLAGVDVCHLFTLAPELYSFCRSAKNRGIPLVISPVFNSPGFGIGLKVRKLSKIPGMYTNLRLARSMLLQADAVLPLTEKEGLLYESIFGVSRSKITIVPNGVDPVFLNAKPDLFVNRFGFRPDLLFVGRIDRNKNILSLIEALKDTNLKLAVIGYPYDEEPDVFKELLRRTGPNVIYVGSLSSDDPLLPSAYAASKVFCLPSFKEVMPLTVLEAILAGCRIAVTRNTAMGNTLGNCVEYLDPSSIRSIRASIERSLNSMPPVDLKEQLFETCTWPAVARSILNVYTKLVTAG